jgi:ABC-type multidrug transport system fused ATPase/permease subunit
VNKFLNLTTLVAAIWWSTVLFEWATISDAHSGEASITLAGSELSQTLVLTPAIVILVALIARYRKVSNLVMLFAALVASWSSYLAFSLNPAASPAAVDGLEKITGMVGTVAIFTTTITPIAYLVLWIFVAVLAILSAFAKVGQRVIESEQAEEPTEPKSVWDSQS